MDLGPYDSFGLIFAMAAVTFATRTLGLAFAGLMKEGGLFWRWMDQMPGAIFAALIAPMALQEGARGVICTLIAIAVMRLSGRILLSMLVAIVAFAMLGYVI